MENWTQKNRTFKTDDNRQATVWQVFTTGRNVTGFVGAKKCVRTFVTVEGVASEFDCEPGCSFQAESVVRQACA
jgi:hypothetical protein